MLRSANQAGEQISVEQILAVSARRVDANTGLDVRGTEVVAEENMPEQRRRKASVAAVSSVDMRMMRLEHQMNQFMETMQTAFATS